MKERFSSTELTALRNDLMQGGLIDSREAAELLQVFLMGRGYGVSPQAAMDAVGRVEMSGCSMPVLQRELEGLALVCKGHVSGDQEYVRNLRGPQNQAVSPRGE